MVQLSDDRVHGDMLQIKPAVKALSALMLKTCQGRAVDHVGLHEADGRVLATDHVAIVNVPPYQNSAVDGYAFAHADLDRDTGSDANANVFNLMPEAEFAGSEARQALRPGSAAKITTGAALPTGSDTVCMLEDITMITPSSVSIPRALSKSDNVRPRGEDFAAEDLIARGGTRLNPISIAALAAGGHGNKPIAVFAKRRVLICSTGDELGTQSGGSVIDANGPMLTTLLRDRWQIDATLHNAVLPDDPTAIETFFRSEANRWDVIITTGGVSTGERDCLRRGFEAADGNLGFWRVAIKPGRPIAVGGLKTCVWVGLPGNPVAAMVTMLFIALPALRVAGGEQIGEGYDYQWVELTHDARKKKSRTEFVRVNIGDTTTPGQLPQASRVNKLGAGMISSMVHGDGLVELEYGDDNIAAGTPVRFTPWKQFGL